MAGSQTIPRTRRNELVDALSSRFLCVIVVAGIGAGASALGASPTQVVWVMILTAVVAWLGISSAYKRVAQRQGRIVPEERGLRFSETEIAANAKTPDTADRDHLTGRGIVSLEQIFHAVAEQVQPKRTTSLDVLIDNLGQAVSDEHRREDLEVLQLKLNILGGLVRLDVLRKRNEVQIEKEKALSARFLAEAEAISTKGGVAAGAGTPHPSVLDLWRGVPTWDALEFKEFFESCPRWQYGQYCHDLTPAVGELWLAVQAKVRERMRIKVQERMRMGMWVIVTTGGGRSQRIFVANPSFLSERRRSK